jgi:hypothetical protein
MEKGLPPRLSGFLYRYWIACAFYLCVDPRFQRISFQVSSRLAQTVRAGEVDWITMVAR